MRTVLGRRSSPVGEGHRGPLPVPENVVGTCYKRGIETTISTSISRLLPAWFRSQRWFVRPARSLLGAEVLNLDPIGEATDSPIGSGLFWVDVNVWYSGDVTERYTLLVALVRVLRDAESVTDRSGVDAGTIGVIRVLDDEYVVVEAMARAHTAAAAAEALIGAASLGSEPDARSTVPSPHRGPASSAVIGTTDGRRVRVKVFRRVDGAANPDIDVPAGLAHADGESAPPVLAAIDRDGRPVLVAASVGVIDRDGTSLLAPSYAELFDRRCRPADLRTDPLADVFQIGRALAEFHVASAEAFGSAEGRGSDWAASMLTALRRKSGERVDLGRQTAVLDRLDKAGDLGRSIRIHHHLHLGNVERMDGQWHVANFEGDGRPFSELGRHSSPLDDLSRLISSVESIGRAVLAEFIVDEDELNRELGVLLEAHEQRVIDALIEGYGSVNEVARLLPSSSDARDALLAVFETHHRIEETVPHVDDAPWRYAVGIDQDFVDGDAESPPESID